MIVRKATLAIVMVASAGLVTVAIPAFAGGAHVHCGDVVTKSIVLGHDLACTGDGLTIGADGVTIDLNYHSVSGPDTATGIRTAGHDGVTVRRGALNGFGLEIRESNNVTVSRVTTPSVTMSRSDHVTLSRVRSAYHIRDSADIAISGGSIGGLDMTMALRMSVADAHIAGKVRGWVVPSLTFLRCRFDGVRLMYLDSPFARFIGNTVVDSSLSPSDSDEVLVENNRFLRSSLSAQIRSRRMIVRDNVFRGGGTALAIGSETPGVRIESNVFVDNDLGVHGQVIPLAMAGLVVRNNVFWNNRIAGLYLTPRSAGASGPMTFAGNMFVNNGHTSGGAVDSGGRAVNDGLHLDGITGDAVVIRDNLTVGNADYGIEVAPGPVTDGGGNTSVGDPSGCLGVACR
jgi:hypothetical protein